MAAFEGRAVADLGLADDDGGLFRLLLRLFDGVGEHGDVVGIGHEVYLDDLPVLRLEAHGDVLFEGDVRIALDGDVVVVVEEDELAELVRAGKRAGLVGDALFKAAVAAQRVGVVIDDGEAFTVEHGRKVRLGDRHADGVRDALSEGARRRLDADGVAVFGVPGRLGAELTELHQILFGEAEAVEIEQGIVEHGTVSRGEDKAVSVVPLGILVVEFEEIPATACRRWARTRWEVRGGPNSPSEWPPRRECGWH